MKKLAILTIAVLSLLLAMSVVAAAPSEAELSNIADRGEYEFNASNNVTVEAGNIRYVDLDTNMSTYRWAGILGDITGNIVLGDNDGGVNDDIMFTWTANGRVVYATEAASIAWASLETNSDANEAAVRTAVETAYAHLANAGDADNLASTFVDTGDVDSGLYTLTGVPRAQTLGGSGWYTYALWDGSAIVFAGAVDQVGGTSYDGDTVNYQMIVPEDGTGNDATATEYNLWVELQ